MDKFVRMVDCNQPEQEARTDLDKFIHRISKYTYAEHVKSDLNIDLPQSAFDIGATLRQPMKFEGRCRTRRPIGEIHAKVKYQGGKVSLN